MITIPVSRFDILTAYVFRGSLGLKEKNMNESDDRITNYLESLDRFLDDPEGEGMIPLKLLAQQGLELPSSSALSEEGVHETLWKLIEAMAKLGIYLSSTDHMSDRELYDYLRNDALREPALVLPGTVEYACHLDPISGGSAEDSDIFLRYYADAADRRLWLEQFPDSVLPASETPPHDRDRLLPRHEDVLFGPPQ